jgi:hypothetical protein
VIAGRFFSGRWAVPERQVPDLGRAGGHREPDQVGVVGLEGAGLGVEGHHRRATKTLDKCGEVAGIVNDDHLERGRGVERQPFGGGHEGGGRRPRGRPRPALLLEHVPLRGHGVGGHFLAAVRPTAARGRTARGGSPHACLAGLRRERAPLPSQPPRQGEELELRQQPQQRLPVGLLEHEVRHVELHGHVALDGDELLREPRGVGLGEQRLAGSLGGHFARVPQNVLERPVLGEQLLGALVTDALHPGHVVAGVADEREKVHHLARRNAEPLGGVGLVHPGLVHRGGSAPSGIEQGDAGADELVEVLVARDDHRLEAAASAGPRQCADDVVGLVARDGHQRDAKRLEQRADTLDGLIEVGLERLVELFAGGLVLGVALFAERGAGVVDPDDVVGTVLLAQAEKKVDDAPGGGGILALAGPQRPADHREERAINQGVAVDEE